jgi:hypothetical protein
VGWWLFQGFPLTAETTQVEYSMAGYRRLIGAVRHAGFQFASFVDRPSPSERCLYLRHDVDFSLAAAVELAEANAALGVRGTFFVLLRSEIYNVLSSWSMDRIRDLERLGQEVALHYLAPPGAQNDDLAERVREDFETIRRDVPSLQRVVSWHNPSEGLLSFRGEGTVGGLVNAYSAAFTTESLYLSDSNLRHSVEALEAALANARTPHAQLLLHPINWVVGGRRVVDVLAGAWRYVIRDREHGMRSNRVYAAVFPEGVPDTIIDGFVREWRAAAVDAPGLTSMGTVA